MKSKSSTSFLYLAALTTACISPQLFALTVTDFAPVPSLEGPEVYGSGGYNTCVGVNSSGVVVGLSATSTGGSRSFAYYSGADQLVDIGTFGGYDSVATAISEGSDIVGYSQDENYYSHAYQFDGYSMNPLSGVWGESIATGINSGFEICGSAGSRAFFQNAIGTYNPPGAAYNYTSRANAINDQSMITGSFETSSPYSHAFLWNTGSNTWTDLGTLGGQSSTGFALNSSNHVVGTAWISNTTAITHAFLYSNGTMADLGSLAGVDGNSYAYGISNQGHVVGASDTYSDGSHAFVYKNGTMHDLNTLAASYLVQDETSEGFTILEEARAIGLSADSSNNYVVVGNGWYRNAQGEWIRQGYILHIAD
jgi:probable HAF family extracellular repeat protein